MLKPTITIHDVETGEIIERPMNAAELALWESDNAATQARETEKAQKAAEKAALLAKLGITDDEAKLLLS